MPAFNQEDWSCDAQEAFTVTLVNPKTASPTVDPFPPAFTHPIYENEAIYGYKDLEIQLSFAADSMDPLLEVSWTAQAPKVKNVEADAVIEPLEDFLPETLSRDPDQFFQDLKNRTEAFTPPGELQKTFKRGSKTYEVWLANVSDERCATLLRNIQMLAILYIDGASTIEVDDEEWSNKRWEVFFLYEKHNDESYSFIGYSALYHYYFFSKESYEMSRVRLSQFLILPPFQRQGLGSAFYDTIMKHYHDMDSVKEITVEDPNQEFDNLRDCRDMLKWESIPEFSNITLQDVVSKKVSLKDLRARTKMPQRHFNRLIEIKLLKSLNVKDKKQYKQYRLFVKKRIFLQSRDVLIQLDRLDRVDKLHETYLHVEDDHKRLLELMKTLSVEEVEENGQGKRKVTDAEERPSKRAKASE
ncbi:acyl-CoA N-acyltransferase [Pyronema omphalodes]|nr:acyl-CoA N-acyltransferase [Pyronema omphalodes]